MAGVHHGQDRTTIQACRFRHASRLLSVCQPQPITAPCRVDCKTALHDTGGNNPWRCRSQAVRQIHLNRSRGKYPPAEPGALGIGPLEAAALNPKLCLTWSAHDIRSPDVTSILYPIFRHSGEQMPLENCVAT